MRLIHKNQRGFTMIELLVALAITGAIAGGIVTAIFQVFSVNTLSNNHMLAVRQVQNAGYFISHDTQMALSIDDSFFPIEDEEHPLFDQAFEQTQVLFLLWVGWERIEGQGDSQLQCIDTYEVYYTYYDNKLWRYQRITTDKYDSSGDFVVTTYSPEEGWGTTFIADYITFLTIEESGDGDKLTVTITAAVGTGWHPASETRTYEITPRPGS